MQSVIIKKDISSALEDVLNQKKYSQVGVLVDSNTENLCYPLVKSNLPSHRMIRVEAGEKFKNLETCHLIWEQLTQNGFDRHAVILVIGGGVLGDMGGFCAATYKRGIDFVLIPTTLLAQVDASVGGKLGVDFLGYKNHIGLFQEPTCTLISSQFIATLPHREIRSGYAEVIKHCLISNDSKWKEISQKGLAEQNWDDLIDFSYQFKSGIAETDPFEGGLRKVLNFGHTVGHAVESSCLSSPAPLYHGEAVAIGMIAESFISYKKGLIDEGGLKEISGYIFDIYQKKKDLPGEDEILEFIKQDKKNKDNTILMTLLEKIGHAVWDVPATENEIRQSLDYYHSL